MPKSNSGFLIFLSAMLFCLSNSWAGPDLIHFQGRLTDNQGKPIGPASDVRVQFSIYSARTGGDPVWPGLAEQSVPTNDAGLFSADIGPVPINIFAEHDELYLQVAVRNVAELRTLSPRQKLTAVPYAYFATYASSAGFAATILDGSVTTRKIHSGAVTADSLAPNSVGADSIAPGAISEVLLSTSVKQSLNPSGVIAMFDHACPEGWSHFDLLDNHFPMGTSSYTGILGGTPTITGLTTVPSGDHIHNVKAHHHSVGTLATLQTNSFSSVEEDAGGLKPSTVHTHPIVGETGDPTIQATTETSGVHSHVIDSDGQWRPPYLGVVFCRKN